MGGTKAEATEAIVDKGTKEIVDEGAYHLGRPEPGGEGSVRHVVKDEDLLVPSSQKARRGTMLS